MIPLLAIAAGAVLGAWTRWALSAGLNRLNPSLPYGTLIVNLAGGLAIGIAMAVFEAHEPAPAWRLFVVTGFLGALTTFSTFSAESLGLLQRGAFSAALVHSAVHILGSLAAAWLGWRIAR